MGSRHLAGNRSIIASAFLVTYLVRPAPTGVLDSYERPTSRGVTWSVEVEGNGNKTSGNKACDIAMVKPQPFASSLHSTFTKRSHSARSMQLKSPCSLSNEQFSCSQS